MRHPYIPSQHHISPLHVLSSPSKDILYIYTRLFAVKISINASSSSLARRRKQQRLTRTRMEILIAINQLPPLQIFSFGGTIKLTSAKCVSDLLCATVPPSLFSTHWGKPLFRSVARTLVTRTQLDRVSIEGPSFSSLFCPASRWGAGFSHEYTSPNQRLIFIDFHPRGRMWGEEGRSNERGGGGWKFQFDSISGGMDGGNCGSWILEWASLFSGRIKISMVIRYLDFRVYR